MTHLGKVAILVEWADSRQPTNEWVKIGARGNRDFCRCYSVGFVVRDDDVIALAANVADVEDEAQATGVIVIPRVAVLKRTTLTSSSARPASKQKRQQT